MVSELNKEDVAGIIGAGRMGSGIAQAAAAFGHRVLLYDSYPDKLGESKYELRSRLQRQVDQDKMGQQEVNSLMDRIDFTEDLTGFGDCRLVIEAVPEDLNIKQDVFRRVEGIVPNGCILATTTSSLSITALSSVLKRPKRFLGIHFCGSAPDISLVEIIPGISSNAEAVQTARNLIEQWGKMTVMARDRPGFIVNRVGRAFYGEALRQLEEGVADVPTIDWAIKEIGGFNIGPFERLDQVGIDLEYKITWNIFEEMFYDPRFKPSLIQKRLVEAGHLGQKSGQGFYEYDENPNNPDPQKDTNLGEEIFSRILVMLINEAADAVFMNIASLRDVDRAMTKGMNLPKGLLKWADKIGLPTVLDQISALQVAYREDRYRPNPLLKRKVRNNDTFY